jgi:hypothetical protein
MAKHYIYESAMSDIPDNDLGGLVEGYMDKKELTETQHRKFLEAWREELERMRQKLAKQKIIVDG